MAEDDMQSPSAKQRIKQLEDKIRRLQHMGDQLRKQIYDTSRRGLCLANTLGFDTIEDAEAAVSSRPDAYNKSFIEHAASQTHHLESQVNKHMDRDAAALEAVSDALREIAALKEENAGMRTELERARSENAMLKQKLGELYLRLESAGKPGGPATPAPGAAKRPLQDVTPRNASAHALAPYATATPPPPYSSPAAVSLAPLASPLPPSPQMTASTDPAVLTAQLHALHTQYAELRAAKARGDAAHAEDYAKWRRFKRWMFDEGEASLAAVMVDGRTPNWKRVFKMRKAYKRMAPRTSVRLRVGPGPDAAGPSNASPMVQDGDADGEAGLADEQTPMQLPQPGPSTSMPHGAPKAPSTLTLPAFARDTSSPSRTVAPDPFSSPLAGGALKRKLDETASSETEEDSQAPAPVHGTQPGLRRRLCAPSTTTTDNTATESPAPSPASAQPTSAGARRSPPPALRIRTDLPVPVPQAAPGKENASPASATPRRSASSMGSGSRPSTPGVRRAKADSRGATSEGRGSPAPEDYARYKGKGRYAAAARAGGSAGKTVNELYAIDPARNEGRDYQFNDVVRNKAQRRHLDAEDCECCRDYYEAVGPLPPRLQPPLWRSPEGTPTKLAHKHKHLPARARADADKRPAATESFEADFDAEQQQQQQQQREIASHRQQISRHRQQWERSKTPPGYWEIGFPNTQEAAEINERARKMHEEKLAKIEQEAGLGGRYKKR